MLKFYLGLCYSLIGVTAVSSSDKLLVLRLIGVFSVKSKLLVDLLCTLIGV